MPERHRYQAQFGQRGAALYLLHLFAHPVELVRGAEPAIESVHIAYEALRLFLADDFLEMAAYVRGEAEFAVAEGSRAAQPPHHVAGSARYAGCAFLLHRAVARVDITAFFQQEHSEARKLVQFQCGEYARRTPAHYDYVVLFGHVSGSRAGRPSHVRSFSVSASPCDHWASRA